MPRFFQALPYAARLASRRRAVPAILISALLAGCSFVPAYERPAVSHGAEWRGQQAAADRSLSRWSDDEFWAAFKSRELNALIEKGLSGNYDLAAAMRRVDQARAQARIAGASLYPQASASSSLAHDVDNPAEGQVRRTDSFSAGLSVSYAVDLWGAARARSDAALAGIEASAYNYRAVAVVLQADIASAYLQALALRERIGVTEGNRKVAAQVLRIVEARFREGMDTALEVAQQKGELARVDSVLVSLRQNLDIAQNQLAVLTGAPPQDFSLPENGARTGLSAVSLPAVAASQPSALLERRPDILAAEASLRAANANIGVARAALYPSVDLGVRPSLTLSPLSGSAAEGLSLAATLTAPIFQGGALAGQVALSQAQKEELVAAYAQSVLTSFREAEDALAAVRASGEALAATQVSAEQAEIAYRLARSRYEAGSTDFQTMLEAQRTRIDATDSLVQARLAQYLAALDLYRAMGGGWNAPAG